MKLSLVVTTRGRVFELQRLFHSLAGQTFRDFEVIVSDQNVDDRLDDLFRNPAWKGPLIRLRNTGGASRGRNGGLDAASGEIIGFPDDDCVYPENLLELVAGFFDQESRYGMLCGRSFDDEGNDSVARHAKHASEIRRETIHLQCIEFAFFVRRASLGDLRFDENMGVGSASPWHSDEGPDLALRLLENGVAGYYDPAFRVWHRRPIKTFDLREIDRTYRYACGNGYFYRKHGYSAGFFAYQMLRNLAGLALALGQLHFGKARLYLARLRGRWRGWTSFGKANEPMREPVVV